MSFDDLKEFNGKAYSGMRVGGSHFWQYPDGTWEETKIAPDKWSFRFSSIKRRREAAPEGSGVPQGTEYSWYILANQVVKKTTKDEYLTEMIGEKYKVGHKRPYWKGFSYTYQGQKTYRQKLIEVLKEALVKLEQQE